MAKSSFQMIIFCILLSIKCSFAASIESSNASKMVNLSVKVVSMHIGMKATQSVESNKLFVNCVISLSSNDNIDGYVDITNNSFKTAENVLPRLPSGWEDIGLTPSTQVSIPPQTTQRFIFHHGDPFVFHPRTTIPIYGTNTTTVFVDVEQLN